MRRIGARSSFVVAVFVSTLARAEPRCGDGDRPVVELTLESETPDDALLQGLTSHVVADLDARGIDVCVGEAKSPVARVRIVLSHPSERASTASIIVNDAVTDKRVERTMKLDAVPKDIRPSALASAADELLRASWLELVLEDAPPPPIPPPPELVRAAVATTRPSFDRTAKVELGASAIASSSFSHRVAFGAEIAGGWWFSHAVGATASAGADFGLARSSAHGSVHADTLQAGLGLVVALFPRDRVAGLDLRGDATLVHASFFASSRGGSIATNDSLSTVMLGGGAEGWARTRSLRWVLGITAIAPVSPVRATDEGRTVTSLEGLGVIARIGLRTVIERERR